ncbi:MAG: hypothetical protein COT73_05260 [Bdellovibrio sp. CG10_big_fil_rev_8_21_14_0_10_47_8]|nr:MAG: hypothetical protein COT73_05260 [Bdellovibrio sp. CG10_big_fil_rev_8_21_14_0_10_47_8]
MQHNATIIEVLIGASLVAVVFLAIRSFLIAKDPGAAGAALPSDLEETLKKIIEKANQVPSAAAVSGEGGKELVEEISKLKGELEKKQKQIEEIKNSPAAAAAPAGGMSSEEKSGLEAKLKELQAKLAEYEIISEDIADLSFYKEQNAKLQKELEAAKGGAPAPAAAAGTVSTPPPAEDAAPPSVAPAPTPPEVPAPPSEAPAPTPPEVPAPPSEAPAPTPPEVPAPPSEAPAPTPPEVPASPQAEATAAPAAAEEPAPAVENVIDDALMAEFAAAVEKQKVSAPAAPAGDGKAAAPAAPAPAATAVAAAAPAAAVPTADDASLGSMDMDKMMAEAAGISAANVPDINPEQALGTEVDENKLLQEAKALEAVKPEDKALMGEFENFVKKNE